MARTRKINRRRKKTRKQRGAGVNCYDKKKTWSCAAQCGSDGGCEKYD